jgi:hypothetical protein
MPPERHLPEQQSLGNLGTQGSPCGKQLRAILEPDVDDLITRDRFGGVVPDHMGAPFLGPDTKAPTGWSEVARAGLMPAAMTTKEMARAAAMIATNVLGSMNLVILFSFRRRVAVALRLVRPSSLITRTDDQ